MHRATSCILNFNHFFNTRAYPSRHSPHYHQRCSHQLLQHLPPTTPIRSSNQPLQARALRPFSTTLNIAIQSTGNPFQPSHHPQPPPTTKTHHTPLTDTFPQQTLHPPPPTTHPCHFQQAPHSCVPPARHPNTNRYKVPAMASSYPQHWQCRSVAITPIEHSWHETYHTFLQQPNLYLSTLSPMTTDTSSSTATSDIPYPSPHGPTRIVTYSILRQRTRLTFWATLSIHNHQHQPSFSKFHSHPTHSVYRKSPLATIQPLIQTSHTPATFPYHTTGSHHRTAAYIASCGKKSLYSILRCSVASQSRNRV